jgi:hypothetical protein
MKYVRVADAILKNTQTNEAGQTIAKSHLRIQTPVRFVEKGLSVIGVRTFVFGWMPIILDDGRYGVVNMAARVEISPDRTTMVTINEVDYYEFHFEPGSIVFPTNQVVQDDKIIYFMLDELHFQAKVPWYMNFNDLCKLLDTSEEFADFGGAKDLEVGEMFASVVGRPKDQVETFLRMTLKTKEDYSIEKTEFVGMNSVYSSVSGTMNRIAGSYFEPSVEAAIVQPSKQIDDVQLILRA